LDVIGLLNTLTGNNLLLWKVIGTTIVFLLAGGQVLLAARFWGASPFPPISGQSAAVLHRWLGRSTITIAIVVAVSCIAGPAGPVSPARVLLHSIFGTLALLILAVKLAIVKGVVRRGNSLLPWLGTSLFLAFAAIWATSVADYVSAT
jgi:hypothetical protein